MRNFVLVGNPNCGKTTLFNSLTKSREYVGNWPGVTVEKKQGILKIDKEIFRITDLPGIYSLSFESEDERVPCDFLLHNKPDAIINVVDATNIESNLYLTTQLIETGIPIIFVLNMIDVAEKQGISIDTSALSDVLGVFVVCVSASKEIGINDLKDVIKNFDNQNKNKIKFKSVLEGTPEFDKAQQIVETLSNKGVSCPLVKAIKILEGDKNFIDDIPDNVIDSLDLPEAGMNIKIAKHRYDFIDELVSRCVMRDKNHNHSDFSDKLDKILLNKYLALPIFLSVMFLIFQVTFGISGNFISSFIERFINNNLSNTINNFLVSIDTNPVLVDLVLRGIIPGLGMILTFLPQIAILFFFLSIFEDSGYIARAAFIMDKPLSLIGLSGKSFVPMLVGFGCSVPAILATRTLDNKKDKRLTILLAPFMSCSARMPVYALITSIFFPKNSGVIIFSLYLIGVIVAAISGFILNKTILRGESSDFIMELPQYRFPTFKNLMRHVYDRVRDFIEKAGTILLLASIVVWFTQSYSFDFKIVSDSSRSILGTLGKFITPIFRPLGFNNWRASVALLTGFIGKETVVTTLSILYQTSDLANKLSMDFTPLSAYCYMVFVLLYVPCIATVAVIKKETASIKWTLFSVVFQILMAWLVSCFIFQIGSLFKLSDLILISLILVLILICIKKIRKSGCCNCNRECCDKKCFNNNKNKNKKR